LQGNSAQKSSIRENEADYPGHKKVTLNGGPVDGFKIYDEFGKLLTPNLPEFAKIFSRQISTKVSLRGERILFINYSV